MFGRCMTFSTLNTGQNQKLRLVDATFMPYCSGGDRGHVLMSTRGADAKKKRSVQESRRAQEEKAIEES
jgi:hypothetical protein